MSTEPSPAIPRCTRAPLFVVKLSDGRELLACVLHARLFARLCIDRGGLPRIDDVYCEKAVVDAVGKTCELFDPFEMDAV